MTREPLRLVLTGAPGSAKTLFFERLRADSRFRDVIFFEEMARLLLQQQPHLRNNWEEFHCQIYNRQLVREHKTAGHAFITDRGTLDIFAFHPQALELVNSTVEAEYSRYTHVVHLGSAANLGEEFYQQDAIRRESRQEALEIEQAICRVWGQHPRYQFVPAMIDIEAKFELLMTILFEMRTMSEMNNLTGRASTNRESQTRIG